jgi:hypothetical protein
MDTIPERFPEELGVEVGEGITAASLITKSRCAFAASREI